MAGSRQICAVLAVASVVAGCHRNATPPAPSPVGAELRAAQPSYPVDTAPKLTIALRNNGTQACSLPSIADGSVEVVSVQRDGVAVIGRPGRESLLGGLAEVVAQSLRSVAPGESISVPLDVEISSHGSPILRTSRQTATDDARLVGWLLDQPGKYRVTAQLVAVTGVQRPDLPPMCPVAGTSATAEFQVTK
ncbi:hypothetical protein PT015_07665 [Candidatus Mycobacterium wuenschmannii]|uniref:DUF4232 domain-containing protein n=1 Tax=Candidatus Mycobacterium wuenschmannii TaxID=3027808 RepID=A0ABY8W175_9MYCO|nr:hypothetical protein [Candidatus Mycobacterium wuenschmannii]WIM89311.1 hypothetical protein PT015_07665 [Candidatus Mycobacterium wuenschmannii]